MEKQEFCFATVASREVWPELKLLVRSLRLFAGKFPVYIAHYGPIEPIWDDNLFFFSRLGQFNLKTVGDDKVFILKRALQDFNQVHYVDVDVMMLGLCPMPRLPLAPVTLSPHFIRQAIEAQYGKYNSGYMLVSDESFVSWWEKQPKEAPGFFGDQQCLDGWEANGTRRFDKFSEQHNVGWWRLVSAPGPNSFRLSAQGNKIIYNDAPLISVHTHIMPLAGSASLSTPQCQGFNYELKQAMRQSTDPRHAELLDLIAGRERPAPVAAPVNSAPVYSDGAPFGHGDNFKAWLGKFINKSIAGLEVGTWEGRSALWQLDNILTHQDAKFTAIDNWEGEWAQKAEGRDFRLKRANFLHNIQPYGNKIGVREGDAFRELPRLLLEGGRFDYIYLDADHSPQAVLANSLVCWELLKSGGVFIWDDYEWHFKGPDTEPKLAIDWFLKRFEGQYRLVSKAYQVCVEKL